VFRPYINRHKIELAGRKGFLKLALREKSPIVPVISVGSHETLIVLWDCYQQAKQLNKWGILPWLFNIDPEVFPIYLGLPWGVGIGALPNFPLPVIIHTRVCPPIIFERYGREAASDRFYVDACYELVRSQMQQHLDQLVIDSQN
jgi:1-acyl-sn-glycerol-3-phosphate acyltransferase